MRSTVAGNANDGIASSDGLVIVDGAITVTAAADGIRGKDYLVIHGGSLTVEAGGDALKSDHDEDATLGEWHHRRHHGPHIRQ